MTQLKKAWVTEDLDSGLVTLTLESADAEIESKRIKTRELCFPDHPTEKNPLRHTLAITCLDDQSLIEILSAINKHLYDL